MNAIAIKTYGQGRPLVMLHGWAMHGGVWRSFAERLAEQCRVICVDLPGHGRSAEPATFRLPEVADAIAQVLPTEQYVILGWSLGATIAVDLATRYPQQVEELIMLAGNPSFVTKSDWPGIEEGVLRAFIDQLSEQTRQTLLRFLALQVNGLDNGRTLLAELKSAVAECPAPTVRTLKAGLEVLLQADLRQQLSMLACPVHGIFGGRDTLVPIATANRLRELSDSVSVSILPEAGHIPFLSHAEQLADLIWRRL